MTKKIDFEKTMMPMAERLVSYAQKAGKKQGLTDVSIAIQRQHQEKHTVEKGQVEQSVIGTAHSIGITLYAGARNASFSATGTMDEKTLKERILQVTTALATAPENKYYIPLDPQKVYQGPDVDLELYDPTPPSMEDLMAYGLEMEAAAVAFPGVINTEISISATTAEALTLATNGIRRVFHEGYFSGVTEVFVEDTKGSKHSDHDFSMARYFSDMASAYDIGDTAGKKALARLGAVVPATAQDVSIVLSPEAAAGFFRRAVFPAISGGNVYRKTTFLAEERFKQIMNSNITLVDDPRILRGLGSSFMDSAGLETKKLTLIKNGVLKKWLVGLASARQLKIAPIGREDGLTNCRVLPGSISPEDLMKDIKTGIYIKDFSGGQVDVNTNNGLHSRQAHGLLIKNGELTPVPVENFLVTGVLRDMFMRVTIANDTPKLPDTRATFAVPTMRIDGVTIAGK